MQINIFKYKNNKEKRKEKKTGKKMKPVGKKKSVKKEET